MSKLLIATVVAAAAGLAIGATATYYAMKNEELQKKVAELTNTAKEKVSGLTEAAKAKLAALKEQLNKEYDVCEGCNAESCEGCEHNDGVITDVIDVDGDGKADAVCVDTTGDGKADTVYADTTGDGKIDTVLVDTDGDGVADKEI